MSPPTRALCLLFACGSCVSACGCPPKAADNIYRSDDGTALFQERADDTLGFFVELVPTLNARRIDVHQLGDDQIAVCAGAADCTTAEVNGYKVNAFWPDDAAPSSQQGHAYALAHELCHVYYFEVGEMGDPSHTHAECFAAPGRPYGDGVGWAWQVAENF